MLAWQRLADRAEKREGVERRCWERRGTSRSQDGEGRATTRRRRWRQAVASCRGGTTAGRAAGVALRGVGAAEVGGELKKHRVCETCRAWRESRSRIS